MFARWENLSRDQLNALDREKTIVLLPLSAMEQHGPHLPVGTDTLILKELVDRTIAASGEFTECDVIFAPQMPVGKSNEHMDFCGTMTFSAKTYYSVIYDLAKSIAHHGFQKLILLNSHGGNTDMANLISRDLRIDMGLQVYVFDWWFTNFWADANKDLQEGGMYSIFHACELETSLMLAIDPSLVKMELAVDELPPAHFSGNKHVTVFGPINAGWRTTDVTKSGVIGEPTLATAEKGQAYFAYAVEKLLSILREISQINY